MFQLPNQIPWEPDVGKLPGVALSAGFLVGLDSIALTTDFFLAFAFAGYFERFSVEGWKIIRAKRPGKFVEGAWVTEWGRRRPAPRIEAEA